MRNLVLILIASIALITFIRALDHPIAAPKDAPGQPSLAEGPE